VLSFPPKLPIKRLVPGDKGRGYEEERGILIKT